MRRAMAVIVIVLAVVGIVTACAKRPVVTEVAVPPAPPVVTPPPAPPAPAPAPPPVTAEPVTPPAPGPERTTRPPAQFAENPALGDIHFNFDKWDIRPRDAGILNAHAAWLKKHPNIVVLIEGHCDERGTNEYNMALGDRRANAARDYLQAHGIAADRMSVVSYGEERPLCREHTTACWAKNRRGRFLTKSE